MHAGMLTQRRKDAEDVWEAMGGGITGWQRVFG
jgi:hypothetical protein